MTQHTPEPWATTQSIAYASIRDASGNLIADTCFSSCNGDVELGEANARRIVACVNACEGIPTDDLEDTKLLPMLDSYGVAIQQRDDLQAQVDELLKAANHLLSNVVFVNFSGEWNNSFVEDVDLTEYCQPLQDTINKITGEPK